MNNSSDPWLARWNDRYSKPEFAFGEQPNEYFRDQLRKLEPGNILLPAEGEGRNAVFAAKEGWGAFAFDISIEGRKKALLLAERNNVTIEYQVGDLTSLSYQEGQFDVIALIYAHFPADIKAKTHRQLNTLLRKGGTVIFEAFSKKHLEYKARNEKVGGPGELAQLFSIEEIKADFHDYEIIELVEREIELKEGAFHDGVGSVIRFLGRKK